MKKVFTSLTFLVGFLVYLLFLGNSSGSIAENTGGPSEMSCARSSCHNTTTNQGSAAIKVDFGDGATSYIPGQTYAITVSGESLKNAARNGFQIVALDDADANVGKWILTNTSDTQLRSGFSLSDREYVTHTTGGSSATAWTMNWEAPATDAGDIAFYLAYNDADNNGSRTGDDIYTTSLSITADNSTATAIVAINFTDMMPHVGQKLEVRLTDKSTGKEADRVTIDQVAGPTFSLNLTGESGNSYYIDFYADLNKNGVYDTPPVDHAWRIDAGTLGTGMNQFNFSHNTDFTDIQWKQNLTFDFTGMTPHIGQKLEVAVRDMNRAGKEVGRVSLDAVAADVFSLDLPFLEIGHSYLIDFYADLNKNGVYDTPPADHAWRETITDVAGDETLSFSHNTDFTDIKWKQLLTFDFSGMTPHIGQKLEVAVRDINRTGKEVGRVSLDAVKLDEFSLDLPFLEIGHSYLIDFYADLNKNGVYDAPPVDHAWRMTLPAINGDQNLIFIHNTDFTDIKWKHLLTYNLTGMAPHIGQKLEFSVREKNSSGKEVGRFTMPSVMVSDFIIELPFIEIGKSYRVDYYADLNKNGVYDVPPIDHAWRDMINDVTGDETFDFAHNTNFTDVQWKHLLTFNLTGMTPHIGQQLQFRVRDVNQVGREVGRFTMPSVMLSDFTVCLPYLDLGRTYFVDFYADLNKNGNYDGPPTDHPWRETISEVSGDANLDFEHNTNFTDIKESNTLTANFTGMTPHLGQLLELRVLESASGKEIERVKQIVDVSNFIIDIPGIQSGKEYIIDFYADLNQNGIYDAPPVDHAWRELFTAGDGNQTFAFDHNTNFTDIDWVYQMTLATTGMTPHLGQKFELQVINVTSGSAVGSFSMPSVMVPFFFVRIPGLRIGENYNADFYADFNQNDTYDAPPIDHAWRVNFDDDDGDEIVTFDHNTDFTDIMFTTAVGEIKELEELTIFPNPFSNSIIISLDLTAKTDLNISLFNNLGQEVKTLWKGNLSIGQNALLFDGLEGFEKGVYFLRISNKSDGVVTTRLINN